MSAPFPCEMLGAVAGKVQGEAEMSGVQLRSIPETGLVHYLVYYLSS